MLDIEKIKTDLESSLSKYRYEHSIRVAEETKTLAKYYGVNEENAYIAGLLHDIAKEYNEEENKYWVDKYNLDKRLLDKKNSKICHAEIGAVVAKELYQVNDEICQAIKYHTIGNIDMNMLDKIIFIADKIESGKNYPGIEEERDLAYKNIDKALINCLENTKKKLERENRTLDVESEKLFNYLKTKNTD